MAAPAPLDEMLAPIVVWVASRSDLRGLALVGSQARGMAWPDSDVDLIVLAANPQIFRDRGWLADIRWHDARVVGWHDADYGVAWSRHVRLAPSGNMEFTFCDCSWASADPVDSGTADVVSKGCCVLIDKDNLFGPLLGRVAA